MIYASYSSYWQPSWWPSRSVPLLLLGDVGCDDDVDDDEIDDDNDNDDGDDDDGDNDYEGGAVGSEYQLGIGRFLQKPFPTFHTIITICDMSVTILIVIPHNLCFWFFWLFHCH